MPKNERTSTTGEGLSTRTQHRTMRDLTTRTQRRPIPEQCEHRTTPGGFSERSAVIAASLSKKLKKYGFGKLKINMHHTCANNNSYSVLTCYACRLPKTPSNSSFVPLNPSNTIPAKPKTTSEKTKTKNEEKPQPEHRKLESPQETRHHRQRRFVGAKTPRNTKYQVAQRLHEEPTEQAIGILNQWVHLTRKTEATKETVALLNDLTDKDVLRALCQLKQPRCHIRRMSGRQLDIKVKVQTLNDTRTFPLKVLLDSGSTGSCIGRKFMNDNEIRTRKTAILVPVHNADGTLNKNGSITNYVFLRLSVGDHMEQLEFAVADLGIHDLFIGHEWLKLHNPNIDWKTSEIRFDQCPKECGYIKDLQDPEADEEDEWVELEPRDKLYALDIDAYL